MISSSKNEVDFEVVPLGHVDMSLLSSLMQKSIRRGLVQWAVSAALALQQLDSAYPWRRLRGIAAEDVSVANPALVGSVLALAGKQSLIHKTGAARLLAQVVAHMAESTKYRTACDLLMLANAQPAIGAYRRSLLEMPRDQWVDLFAEPDLELWQRAALLQLIAGLSERVGNRWLGISQPNSRALRAILDRLALPAPIEYIAVKGTRTDALAQLSLLCLQPALGSSTAPIPLSQLESSLELIGGVPAFAYCLFSGPGRAALRLFLRGNHGLSAASLVRQGVKDPLRALGHLVFQLEGGQCDRMLDSPQITAIRAACEQATLVTYGVIPLLQSALKAEFPKALSALNQARHQIAGHLMTGELFP